MSKNTGKTKILAIDDSPDMLYLEKIALEREGFEVITVNNAEAALEMIPSLENISLILCDVQMDHMNGLEFVKSLEREHRDVFNTTPVVLVTGLDNQPQANVAGYIHKPTDIDEFAAKVRSFLSLPELTII